MHIKQANEDQGPNWKYLPVIDTLLEYLCRKDLIELSKCCKRYRSQLERVVLENLCICSWANNNRGNYSELLKNRNINIVLESLKNDLGNKLKFVKKTKLDCNVDCDFAQLFIKLLPNIKTLRLNGAGSYDCCLGEGLATILKGMQYLEHLDIRDITDEIDNYSTKIKIFPKSIKSLKISYFYGSFYREQDDTLIYDTIDISYTNLHSLTIISNRMLQNLTLGMPNLKEVEIIRFDSLDKSVLVKFLKANPQLRKLDIISEYYNEEIINIVLSSKCLERWHIDRGSWEGIELNNLASNYSIKYLKTKGNMNPHLSLKIINACKGLETLQINYFDINGLYFSKYDKRINILKLNYSCPTISSFNEIDSSKQFNEVHLHIYIHVEKLIEDCNIDKLKNYKFIPLTSQSFKLKLINKVG